MTALKILLVVTVLQFFVWIVVIYQNRSLRQDLRRANVELDWFNSTYLHKQGWSLGIGNYRYISLDGGKTWWNATRKDNGEVIIDGPANAEHISQLEGMDTLIMYARKHGPINLSDPKGLEILQNAGFTVRVNPK
jgi:hypothetical protein